VNNGGAQGALDVEVEKRLNAAIGKAVAEAELQQTARILDVVNARLRQAEARHRAELVTIQDDLLRIYKMNTNYVRTLYEAR
jgi:hypothetical protein